LLLERTVTGVKKYGKTVKRYEITPFSRSFSRFGTPIPAFQAIRPFYVVLAPFPVQNAVAKHVPSRVAIKPYIYIFHLFVCLNSTTENRETGVTAYGIIRRMFLRHRPLIKLNCISFVGEWPRAIFVGWPTAKPGTYRTYHQKAGSLCYCTSRDAMTSVLVGDRQTIAVRVST
jgi:hypothetical protein